MSHILPIQQPAPVRPRRYKTSLACTTCRRRKLKCDGQRPVCGRCQDHEHRESCTYIQNVHSGSSASNLPPKVSGVASSQLQSTVPANSTPMAAETVAAVEQRGTYENGEPVEFASQVRAAIDANLGLPAAKKRCPIPLTDAPLFGEGLLRNSAATGGISSSADNMLPARKHADHLISLYWRDLEPIEPLFDQSCFSRAYQALFSGSELECDEQVFCSTLNCIFALSTQLQEWLPPEQRDEVSQNYFQRAWSLLRPEVVVWEPGSVAVVQCLLLMARYLQCTRNLHQTWMAVGSAVHISRSLGLHSPPTVSSSAPRDSEGWLGRQVWRCCASMDRALSWTLGQYPITSLMVSPLSIDLGLSNTQTESPRYYAAKMAELNDITSYIMLLQAATRSGIADGLGLQPVVHSATDMNTVAKIDERLSKFEQGMAQFWDTDGAQKETDSARSRQRVLFGLRLAHARTLLFRPILASFCLQQGSSAPGIHGLEGQILQTCATLCVENVQRMIATVCDDYRPGKATTTTPDGRSLPWWHRLFYLYLSSQHLIVAMIRPNIFRHMVVDYWDKAISSLCAHEHLSPSITRCISSFRGMWHKVIDAQDPAGLQVPPETFQDIFQHLGFETDGQQLLNLGLGDASWTASMANFDWNPGTFLDGGEDFIITDSI